MVPWTLRPPGCSGRYALHAPVAPTSAVLPLASRARCSLRTTPALQIGRSQVRRFYEGFAMFLKTAKSFNARFTHISNLPKLQVAIYFNDENQVVSKVPVGPNFITFEKIKAAAIIPVRIEAV